jgi:hypothetical protein
MKKSFSIKLTLLVGLVAIFGPTSALAGPVSTNFELKEFNYGSGGTEDSDSTNYSLFGVVGEVDLGDLTGSTYRLKAGLIETIQAPIVAAPTLGNGSNTYYNKLSLSFSAGGNPTDSQFLIAVSTDDFGSDIRYIQANQTLGSSQVWQTFSSWNSGSFNIIGLSPGTTYYVKIASRQGNYTQSPYSGTSSQTTATPTLTFDIDIASTDTNSDPPFEMDIGDLIATTVVTASNKVWVDLETNGTSGGSIYVYGTNGGLLSTTVAKTITSSTADLASIPEGYGARYNNVAQTSGGPIQPVTPYDGVSDNVGVLDSTKRIIFDSNNLPVVAGRASFLLKAKASAVTEAAPDYSDTLTVLATANY